MLTSWMHKTSPCRHYLGHEERVVRLQRLMATDPELRRPRMRWKARAKQQIAGLWVDFSPDCHLTRAQVQTQRLQDATAVLARRDELQDCLERQLHCLHHASRAVQRFEAVEIQCCSRVVQLAARPESARHGQLLTIVLCISMFIGREALRTSTFLARRALSGGGATHRGSSRLGFHARAQARPFQEQPLQVFRNQTTSCLLPVAGVFVRNAGSIDMFLFRMNCIWLCGT